MIAGVWLPYVWTTSTDVAVLFGVVRSSHDPPTDGIERARESHMAWRMCDMRICSILNKHLSISEFVWTVKYVDGAQSHIPSN